MVAAARPLVGQITAPVLGAILRKRLAALAELGESDMREIFAPSGPAEHPAQGRAAQDSDGFGARPQRAGRSALPRPGMRRPPSLTRQFIRGLLLLPALARSLEFPSPDTRTPESAALTALVEHCAESERPPTTAYVLQAFAGTSHADLFASILSDLPNEPLEDDAIEAEMREGLTRWWHQARLQGRPAPAAGMPELPSSEGRRLAQLEYIHQAQKGAASTHLPADPPDPHGPEGSAMV